MAPRTTPKNEEVIMLSGISIWQLLILLVIVLLVFGSKRLRHLGPDLGSALKGFRSAMKDEDDDKTRDAEHKAPEAVDHANRDDASTHDEHGRRRTGAENDSTGHRD